MTETDFSVMLNIHKKGARDTMFENIGGKIKTLATTITWVGIIGFVILGILTMDTSSIAAGLLIALFGSLLSWISSWLLYALGELVENSQRQTELLQFIAERIRK